MSTKQRIVRLKAGDIKRLVANAVDFTPEGNVIIIGGMNAEGKSSVLDSIEMALEGKRAFPPDPVHHGAASGSVELTLTDYEVTRKIKPDGSHTLVVKSRDGSQRFSSPQELLDGLKSDLSFDPLAFLRMDGRQQVDALRTFTGLDFKALDAERAKHYELRTASGRDVTARENLVAGMPYHTDAPAAERTVGELAAELLRRQEVNRANADRVREVATLEAESVTLAVETQSTADAIAEAESAIAKWQEALQVRKQTNVEAVKKLGDHQAALTAKREEVAALVNADTDEIQQQINSIDDDNRKVRENAGYTAAKANVEAATGEYKRLTALIEAIDAEKAKLTEAAKMPIPKLGFGENGLMYGGVPFEQCSSAEQLRVSVAMGAALNPQLAVMLIRDGSLLDVNSRAEIRRLADEYDLQLWLETVGEGQDCQIIIEEGKVKK